MKFFLVQMTLVACGLYFTQGLVAQDAEADSEKAPLDGPALIAKFSEEKGPTRTLFLYSEVELKSVYVWLHWQWVKAEKEEFPHPGKQYHLYRVTQRLIPAVGQKLLVNTWDMLGDRTFRHTLMVEKKNDLLACAVELESVRTHEEYLADKAESDKKFNDPYGFISLVNHYRATRGLGSLVHDPGLSYDASVNNSMGSPHAYMGRARVQNWAAGYVNALGALRAWQNSPGHNRNLLNPSITRGGISFDGREWTFNGG